MTVSIQCAVIAQVTVDSSAEQPAAKLSGIVRATSVRVAQQILLHRDVIRNLQEVAAATIRKTQQYAGQASTARRARGAAVCVVVSKGQRATRRCVSEGGCQHAEIAEAGFQLVRTSCPRDGVLKLNVRLPWFSSQKHRAALDTQRRGRIVAEVDCVVNGFVCK